MLHAWMVIFRRVSQAVHLDTSRRRYRQLLVGNRDCWAGASNNTSPEPVMADTHLAKTSSHNGSSKFTMGECKASDTPQALLVTRTVNTEYVVDANAG
jgi:hypothetical protein